MEEVWKDIKGFEEIYQVSNFGRVKSLLRKRRNRNGYFYIKEKILKQSINTYGYLQVCLYNNCERSVKRVHRLVAETFIPNPSNKPEVNHIDGNKTNNKIDNLEWVTSKENITHAFKIGLRTVTEEQKTKLRILRTGKKFTKEQREKLSEIRKGENNPFYGKHHNEKTKNKISEANKGKMEGIKHPRCKKIICITTGEIFDYMKQAEDKYGIPKSNICKCCKGEIKSAGKHPITKEKMIWKYIE
ncbi:MAG: NUMOD4 domain-containing protein [Romboutsia timonensis]|uniref:NUMOD4 domain-containing protein n=1 Tax=Romboutsia timonensis TaxID=1776391 RepID=UPI002A7626C7|nr:NUMOD4 domain-containing protein [Romboutsia timonensis]MDY2883057.1 NUMOD4 domain-containing protein [Romboutsia timonensis]